MACADGTGSYVGFTVVVDGFGRASGDAGEKTAETQAYIRAHSVLLTAAGDVHGLVRMRSFSEWTSSIESFDSPSAEDGDGNLMRKRKGCTRSNPSWTAVVEYNGEYAIEALIGAEGTIRRWNPDGSYREGYGWIVGAAVFPSQAPGEESLGSIEFQWQGGGSGDAGFVTFTDSAAVEQYPALP